MKIDKKEILKELLLSESRGYVLNIKIRGIARPVKTAVQYVGHNSIILHSHCIFGDPVAKNVLTLLDIEWVRNYRLVYGSPAVRSLQTFRPVA